jgi:hypothetical protein
LPVDQEAVESNVNDHPMHQYMKLNALCCEIKDAKKNNNINPQSSVTNQSIILPTSAVKEDDQKRRLISSTSSCFE